MFKGKKESYSYSVARPFLDTRIGRIINAFIIKNILCSIYLQVSGVITVAVL